MTVLPPQGQPARWLWPTLPLLALGSVAVVVIWVLLALYTSRQNGWMAVVAALDMALVLRLSGPPRGIPRRLVALLATAAIIVAACWLVAAAQIGIPLGLYPWESALKMGPRLAWTLLRLASTHGDVAWMGLGLALAPLASR